MNYQAGHGAVLAQGVLRDVARYRHGVFVEKLGWSLQCEEGMEFDQFDGPETLYVVALHDERVVGTARLLPTTCPYLLGEVFPGLMGTEQVPNDPQVWELSRFAAGGIEATNAQPLSQFNSPLVTGLLDKVLEVAAAHGARWLVTVSPLGIERLLRRYGFNARRAAPPVVISGQALFACWIDVSPRAS